jgi:hypothetical protein
MAISGAIKTNFQKIFQSGNVKPYNNTILLTGLPRSGTSLVCTLLNDLPDTVALNEPMHIMDLAGKTKRKQLEMVVDFSQKCRDSLLENGNATSLQINGKIAEVMFAQKPVENGLRDLLPEKGIICVNKSLSADFTLTIKHNLGFTAILEKLTTAFRCFGVIRNPLSVIASWQTINMPLSRGKAPVAEALDKQLRKTLAETDDVIEKQIQILNWFFLIYRKTLPPSQIIRYEELISGSEGVLQSIVPGNSEHKIALTSRNTNPLYDKQKMILTGEHLLKTGGAFLYFYPKEEIETLLHQLSKQA